MIQLSPAEVAALRADLGDDVALSGCRRVRAQSRASSAALTRQINNMRRHIWSLRQRLRRAGIPYTPGEQSRIPTP